MADYDSVLKEKRQYEEPVVTPKKRKKFPWLVIDVICILFILIISYLVYYNTILAPDKIFLNNISQVYSLYDDIFQKLNFKELSEQFQLEGTIEFQDFNYNFGAVKAFDKFKLDLAFEDDYLLYYRNDNARMVQLSGLNNKYIILERKDNLKNLNETQNRFVQSITKDDYIRKFYFDGTLPVVEVNLVLKQENIQNILGMSNFKGQYEVLFTFKNHAFTNEILNMKVSIQNLDDNTRTLIVYEDNKITYSNDKNMNLKFQISNKNEDFTLKIYKDDVLHSVLSGIKKEDSYQYVYQIIDKIYNLSLEIKKEDTGYMYLFTSNIEQDNEMLQDEVKINFNIDDGVDLDNVDVSELKDYVSLTEDDKNIYEENLDKIVGPLREFINKYKDSIY